MPCLQSGNHQTFENALRAASPQLKMDYQAASSVAFEKGQVLSKMLSNTFSVSEFENKLNSLTAACQKHSGSMPKGRHTALQLSFDQLSSMLKENPIALNTEQAQKICNLLSREGHFWQQHGKRLLDKVTQHFVGPNEDYMNAYLATEEVKLAILEERRELDRIATVVLSSSPFEGLSFPPRPTFIEQ